MGAFAINPTNGDKVRIWTADYYVLASYGIGAFIAVPAHDERNFALARKFNMPIQPIIVPKDVGKYQEYLSKNNQRIPSDAPELSPFSDEGIVVNSGEFSGLTTIEAREKMAKTAEINASGKHTVNGKLRDWLFSRQRYWGNPSPFCGSSNLITTVFWPKTRPIFL
jgi:leucyl-tRNA synthetase